MKEYEIEITIKDEFSIISSYVYYIKAKNEKYALQQAKEKLLKQTKITVIETQS